MTVCKSKVGLGVIVLSLLAIGFVTSAAAQQVIMDPNAPGPGFAHPDGTIAINPMICREMGRACGFVIAHERCHYMVGGDEDAADRCAARTAAPDEVRAAIRMHRGRGGLGDGRHSSDWARAANIESAAEGRGFRGGGWRRHPPPEEFDDEEYPLPRRGGWGGGPPVRGHDGGCRGGVGCNWRPF
jgi:hypothetical protein